MNKIQEFRLHPFINDQGFTLPKNSQVLSARFSDADNMIIVDILVDFDNDELVNKYFHIFNNEDIIDDNMKADYIGTVVDSEEDMVYYIFERIR